eukprot:3430139-Amphidinium_carterae.1
MSNNSNKSCRTSLLSIFCQVCNSCFAFYFDYSYVPLSFIVLLFEEVNGAIKSPGFWIYGHMIEELNSLATSFAGEVEGCPCHSWMQSSAFSTELSRFKNIRERLAFKDDVDGASHRPCPLAGMKACEFAIGDRINVYFAAEDPGVVSRLLAATGAGYFQEATFSVQSACLVMLHKCLSLRWFGPLGVTEADLQKTITDYHLGRQHMLSVIQLKLHVWTQPPWSLAKLGVSTADVAQRYASEILKDFDARSGSVSEALASTAEHRLTMQYLAPGEIRTDLEKFAAGKSMSSLPALRRVVAGLILLPVVFTFNILLTLQERSLWLLMVQYGGIQCEVREVERQQEGDHSLIHRATTMRTVTAGYVANCLRGPEIEQLMSHPPDWHRYLRCLKSVLDLNQLATCLGIVRHPLWQKCLQEKAHHSTKVKVAMRLMYSSAVEEQFVDLNTISRKRKTAMRCKKRAQKRWELIMNVASDSKFSLQAIERHAMARHLGSRMQRDRVYSVPKSLKLSSFASDRQSSDVQDHIALDMDAPMMSSAEARDPLDDQVYLKLVSTNPSRHKLGPLPPAAVKHFHSTDLCVAIHSAWHMRSAPPDARGGRAVPTQPVVQIEPRNVHAIGDTLAVLSLVGADVEALQSEMLSWSCRSGICYALHKLPLWEHDQCEEALKRLVLENCFASRASGRTFMLFLMFTVSVPLQGLAVASSEENLLKGLRTLESWNYASSYLAGKQHFWRLTEAAARDLRMGHVLCRPVRMFAALEDDLAEDALAAATGWQLFDRLRSDGWQLRKKPHKSNTLHPYTLTSRIKDWFIPGITLDKVLWYMRALLKADELLETTLQQLHHCQPEKYYKAVLSGASGIVSHASQPVLEMDGDTSRGGRRKTVTRERNATRAVRRPAVVQGSVETNDDLDQLLDDIDAGSAHTSDASVGSEASRFLLAAFQVCGWQVQFDDGSQDEAQSSEPSGRCFCASATSLT